MDKVLKNESHHNSTFKVNKDEETVNEMSLLFNEDNFLRSKWRIDIPTTGYASTSNTFYYELEPISHFNDEDLDKAPSILTVENFINMIFRKMKLSNEICLLSLIFIERLMVKIKLFYI